MLFGNQEANDLLKILADPQLYKSAEESLKNSAN
jgi:hypothetical protein